MTIGQVSPGDQMQASITQQSPGQWQLSISDVSVPGTMRVTLTYNGLAASAEWIEELPTAVGSAQPTLANFGSATFTDMTYAPIANVR